MKIWRYFFARRLGRVSYTHLDVYKRQVQKDNGRRQLLDFLGAHRGEAGIVYCLSRKKVEQTAEFLCEQGFNCLLYTSRCV